MFRCFRSNNKWEKPINAIVNIKKGKQRKKKKSKNQLFITTKRRKIPSIEIKQQQEKQKKKKKRTKFCIVLSFVVSFLNQAGSQNSIVPASSSSSSASSPPLRMPPPTSGGINEPQECPYCRRTFSCYYSLKRHFQDKHEQSDTLYVCEFCHRRYRTKNSLTTHKSLQHRGSSGMLKRLLKTSAIKNVIGHHGSTHPHPHLFDFTAELGQSPSLGYKEKHLV